MSKVLAYFKPPPHMMKYKARSAMYDDELRSGGGLKCGSQICDYWMLLMLKMDEG